MGLNRFGSSGAVGREEFERPAELEAVKKDEEVALEGAVGGGRHPGLAPRSPVILKC